MSLIFCEAVYNGNIIQIILTGLGFEGSELFAFGVLIA